MGIGVALQPYNFLMAMIGLVLGVIVGVLPGLGGANGVAILIPLTVTMAPIPGVILLASIYWGALYGGSMTSILFNIPGEPWSVATISGESRGFGFVEMPGRKEAEAAISGLNAVLGVVL